MHQSNTSGVSSKPITRRVSLFMYWTTHLPQHSQRHTSTAAVNESPERWWSTCCAWMTVTYETVSREDLTEDSTPKPPIMNCQLLFHWSMHVWIDRTLDACMNWFHRWSNRTLDASLIDSWIEETAETSVNREMRERCFYRHKTPHWVKWWLGHYAKLPWIERFV